jgi:RND family efflux transporter MFP subunit
MKRLLAVLFLAGLAIACHGKPDSGVLPPPLVRTVVVAPAKAGPIELRGSVASQARARLGFKLGGVIDQILVAEADRVAKDQILARMNDVDARSLVRAARAARDKARRDAERTVRLAREGALATSVRDDAQSALDAAEAQLAQAEDALERMVLRAPMAGTVFMRLAEPGETVGAGTPVVVLDTTGDLQVTAGATEREIEALRVRQPVLLVRDGGRTLAGRVRSLAAAPNPADGLYAVEVAPDPAALGGLLSGALVRMRFETSSPSDAWRIPLEALVHRLDHDFVFVVSVDKDGRASARIRAVVVGEAEGGELAIRSGLVDGERIVAEGAYFLQDGQTVRILD